MTGPGKWSSILALRMNSHLSSKLVCQPTSLLMSWIMAPSVLPAAWSLNICHSSTINKRRIFWRHRCGADFQVDEMMLTAAVKKAKLLPISSLPAIRWRVTMYLNPARAHLRLVVKRATTTCYLLLPALTVKNYWPALPAIWIRAMDQPRR